MSNNDCPFPVVRVGGVERHGRRFRVRCFGGEGQRHDLYWPEDQEAHAAEFVRIFRARSTDRSIGVAVNEYLDHLSRFGGARRRPLKPQSLSMVRSKLIVILALVDRDELARQRGKRERETVYHDRSLSSLTPVSCTRLYRACVESGLAADTHRGYLVAANAFGGWCLERGYLKCNPFADVQPEGELSKGKPQHTLDEARRFIAAGYADPHPLGGLAAAAVLTLGVRANELLDRTVRDLDDRGRVLVIPRSKTDAGRRRVAIPEVLRARLLKLAEGQAPDARLFGSMTDGSLLGHVKRLCEVAGVPTICTHGLRGTHLTLTMDVEIALSSAARSVGHAGIGVSRAHYLAAGAEQSARAARLEALLFDDDARRADGDGCGPEATAPTGAGVHRSGVVVTQGPDDRGDAAATAARILELRAELARLEMTSPVALPLGTPPSTPSPKPPITN